MGKIFTATTSFSSWAFHTQPKRPLAFISISCSGLCPKMGDGGEGPGSCGGGERERERYSSPRDIETASASAEGDRAVGTATACLRSLGSRGSVISTSSNTTCIYRLRWPGALTILCQHAAFSRSLYALCSGASVLLCFMDQRFALFDS